MWSFCQPDRKISVCFNDFPLGNLTKTTPHHPILVVFFLQNDVPLGGGGRGVTTRPAFSFSWQNDVPLRGGIPLFFLRASLTIVLKSFSICFVGKKYISASSPIKLPSSYLWLRGFGFHGIPAPELKKIN